MNRYVMLRRLRWPAIVMLVGVLALLHQLGVIRFWHLFVPLLLILLGLLMLAERAILATEGFPPYPGASYGSYSPGTYQEGAPYQAANDPLAAAAAAPQASDSTSTAIVPSPPGNIEIHSDRGGES